MKKFYTLISSGLIIILITSHTFAQNAAPAKTFNLPPGVVLAPKAITDIDYSYKLKQLPEVEPKKIISKDFLKDKEITKEELAEMQLTSPDSYQYYTTASNYYKNLSNKVKVTFTNEELWYIYYFDQELKNTLQNIK